MHFTSQAAALFPTRATHLVIFHCLPLDVGTTACFLRVSERCFPTIWSFAAGSWGGSSGAIGFTAVDPSSRVSTLLTQGRLRSISKTRVMKYPSCAPEDFNMLR